MLIIVEYILFVYFGLSVMYVGIFSLAGLWRKKEDRESISPKNRIAVLVPAYKEDAVMSAVIKNLLVQEYPTEAYQVILIADSFNKETLQILKKHPIQVLEVKFKHSTKAKSLNYALNIIDNKLYDIAVISDADNLMHPEFLSHINSEFNQGNHFIQGRRVAKNMNTDMATLDTANEIINNHIFRKGFNALGLSSALIGSGMAFPFQDLKKYLSKINAVGGFDKELQLAIMQDGNSIKYVEDAIVFDEKIETTQAFEHQRKRWISSHYTYFARHLVPGMRMLFKGNLSYFNIAVVYNLFLPRMITIGALSLLIGVYAIWQDLFKLPVYVWVMVLLLYIGSLLIPIPRQFYGRLSRTILLLPKVIAIMVRSLLKMKESNKKFLHTAHSQTEINNDLVR